MTGERPLGATRSAMGDAATVPPAGFFVGADDPHSAPPSRRRRGHENRARIAITLTSLIDVTFLLLVYFILATQFESGEEIYPVDLPRRLQGQGTADPFRLDEEPVRIEVSSYGMGAMQYRIRVTGFPNQPQTFAELESLLRSVQANEAEGSGWLSAKNPIVVQPARSATWDHVVAAFNAAARARYTNILFADPT